MKSAAPGPFAAAFALLLPALLPMVGCTETRVTLGQAYVAPSLLRLHTDLSSKSNVVAELKHGDRVDIVDVQRRMVRVLTRSGAEGWIDSGQLLSPEQMTALQQRRKQQSLLPPEGTATAYETLNIHIDPERQSPSFAQIPEGGSVTILGHKVVPKSTTPSRSPGLVFSRPQMASHRKNKEQRSSSISFRLPPKPAPPKPPANWLELSAERIDGEEPVKPSAAAAVKPPPPAPAKNETKPVVMDDWTLLRTRNNEIGWALTRNLLMSIPDDVAQYAEGKTITGFFDVGAVNDEEKGVKHNWLWSTSARGLPYDFDSWRVFLWNNHRHRYETSFRQHDLEGYFPIRVYAPDTDSKVWTFSIVTKDDDGQLRLRRYSFDGHLVHLMNAESYNPAAEMAKEAAALNTKDMAAKVKQPGWLERQFTSIKRRLFGS